MTAILADFTAVSPSLLLLEGVVISTMRFEFPVSSTKNRLTANCASSKAYIAEMSDNELFGFLETGKDGDTSLCDSTETVARKRYTPHLNT